MSETPPPSNPNPFDRKMLTRIGLLGAIIGILAIGVFILLWLILGNLGLSEFPRLIASVCIPPTILTFIIGIYLLTSRPPN